MSNIAIIPQFNLPAHLLEQFQGMVGADDLDAGVSSGFPVMSIRGAKWRVVEGGEEHPVYMPGTRDLAPFVKVVLLRSNANVSKTFYAGQFVEGSDAKPDCSSNDGIAPSADSPAPQSDKCATCPQNVWGSKVSPSGSKIKACADVRRLAILPAEDMDYSPILLRVPGASLGDLAAYGKALKQRGIPYSAVVTKLSFDAEAAFPKIVFQFERVLTQEEMAKIVERMRDPVIDDVLGLTSRGAPLALAAPAADKFGIPADVAAPAPVATAAPTPAPTPAPTEAPAKPTRAKKGGFGAAPAAEAQPTTAAEAVAQATALAQQAQAAQAPAAAPAGGMLDDINAALASLNL